MFILVFCGLVVVFVISSLLRHFTAKRRNNGGRELVKRQQMLNRGNASQHARNVQSRRRFCANCHQKYPDKSVCDMLRYEQIRRLKMS